MAASRTRAPLWITVTTAVVLLAVGTWALDLQARQARDTRRTLDLEDLELALNRLLAQTGTLPPADEPTWCGALTASKNREVRERIERALRETKKYARPEKPFPIDPRFGGADHDYVYWKTSPVSFELLAHLEADANNSRPLDLDRCSLSFSETAPSPLRRLAGLVTRVFRRGPGGGYDYALISVQRSAR